jgi:circadian clock protein KaiC
MRYFEHHGSLKKAISVMKKRTGAHETAIRELWFDGKGIHLGEPLMQLHGILTGVPDEVLALSSAQAGQEQRP